MTTLDISKRNFCKIINIIQNFQQERDAFTESIEKFCDGYIILTLGDSTIQSLVEYLEVVTYDDGDYINWWLYEDVEKVVFVEEQEISLSTAEQLYDFLEENCNEGNINE